jgi:hypothetical protein
VRSWWTDGVLRVTLTQPTPTWINAIGAAIWAGKGRRFYLAPFECDFHFAAPGDSMCERMIIRFGKQGKNGQIVQLSYESNPDSVIESRPTRDSDWAFAVEFS